MGLRTEGSPDCWVREVEVVNRFGRNGSRRGAKPGRAGMARRLRTVPGVPLELRLRALAEAIPASTIDEIWVFPPLPDREIASEFIVLVCYDGGAARRRILTAHMDARRPDPERDEVEWVQRVREHGAAPHDWVAGIPDRLLKRLSDVGVPEVIRVEGRPEAWEAVVARYANGNGAASAGAAEFDMAVQKRISFTTVSEMAASGNGAHRKADG